MHELSIATNIMNIVNDYATAAGGRVQAIDVSIGALTCVHEDALRFSFQLVTESTALAGAELRLHKVPLAVYCLGCDRVVDLPGIQLLRCPVCGTASSDIRRGQELDVDSIEIVDE